MGLNVSVSQSRGPPLKQTHCGFHIPQLLSNIYQKVEDKLSSLKVFAFTLQRVADQQMDFIILIENVIIA